MLPPLTAKPISPPTFHINHRHLSTTIPYYSIMSAAKSFALLAAAALLLAPLAAAAAADGTRLRNRRLRHVAAPITISGSDTAFLLTGARHLAQAKDSQLPGPGPAAAEKPKDAAAADKPKDAADKPDADKKPKVSKPVYVTIGAYGSIREWDEKPAPPEKADPIKPAAGEAKFSAASAKGR